VVAIVGIALFLVAPGTQVNGARIIEPGILLRVEGMGAAPKTDPLQMSADELRRARAVAESGVPLLPNSLIGGYPGNYLGYVGYVWQLPHLAELEDAAVWSQTLRARYAVEIPHAMLQSGDILVNQRSGAYGHAVVFERWLDTETWSDAELLSSPARVQQQFARGAQFQGFEVDRTVSPARVISRSYTLQSVAGAITIRELEGTLTGPYTALRNNRMSGNAVILKTVRVEPLGKVGSKIPARYILLNQGGMPIRLNKLTVLAYGPSAPEQGLAATKYDFGEVNGIVLQPGQIYEYSQATSFREAGTYVALPRFEVDGVMRMPLTPSYFQVRAN
jgi:hypothetical protein